MTQQFNEPNKPNEQGLSESDQTRQAPPGDDPARIAEENRKKQEAKNAVDQATGRDVFPSSKEEDR